MRVREPSFDIPQTSEKVWRYMDLAKFISLIDKEQLFFSRVDMFGDPYEGILPSVSQRTTNLDRRRRSILVNSWHLSEYESAAMWAIYSQVNSGIAIQSTYGRLDECFEKTPDPVYIGKVKYIDYSREQIDDRNILLPFVHKRKSFAYENELRVITVTPNGRHIQDSLEGEQGKYVKVDLGKLIERIYVSPRAPPWLGELVKSILERFGHESYKVRVSKLYSLG
jgi:hypothetical protein